MKYSQALIDRAVQHARKEAPAESVGFFYVHKGRMKYHAAANVSTVVDNFAVAPSEYESIEAKGEVVALVHSHVNASAAPSLLDQKAHSVSGLDWLIIGINDNNSDVETHFMPSVEPPSLYGREYVYGVTDCFSFMRDFYRVNFGIELQDFERGGEWWKDGHDYYVERFHLFDFVEVNSLEYGDVLLMTVGANVANHLAVYVDDNMIEHHLMGRLSGRDIYGQFYRDRTTHVLRHKSRITNDQIRRRAG